MAQVQDFLGGVTGYESLGWILLVFFLLFVVIQLLFYWIVMARLAWYKPKLAAGVQELPSVSVIICARNDYAGLEQNLPLILRQDYPSFEVVVVDDGSNDESDLLLKQMSNQYKHLKVITLGNSVSFMRGKKLPLSIGIKSASFDTLLFTDAVCQPASQQWIRQMAGQFSQHKELVIGYAAYTSRPGFLNKLIRLDTVLCALRYGGMAIAGMPYKGIGRNLAYTRSLFYKVKGFTSHYNIMEGDDDLFVNQVASKGNTSGAFSPEAFTFSTPPMRIGAWIRKKAREMLTFPAYKSKHKRILRLYHASHFLLFPFFVFSMIAWGFSIQGYMAMAAFFIWMFSHLIIVHKASLRLKEEKISLISLPGYLLLSFLYAVSAIYALFMKRRSWR